MVSTRQKEQMTQMERALIAAKLSAYAYRTEKQAKVATKKMGFPWCKLISKDGAEVLVVKDRNDLWFAFRGTEPSKLNDVTADLKLMKNAATAGGKVHSGFQQEVNDLWMDVLAEIEHNQQLKVQKDIYMTGHSLGAAMATICASRLEDKFPQLYTYGSPRVGGSEFVNNCLVDHYRHVNNNDIVTSVPFWIMGFRHHGDLSLIHI